MNNMQKSVGAKYLKKWESSALIAVVISVIYLPMGSTTGSANFILNLFANTTLHISQTFSIRPAKSPCQQYKMTGETFPYSHQGFSICKYCSIICYCSACICCDTATVASTCLQAQGSWHSQLYQSQSGVVVRLSHRTWGDPGSLRHGLHWETMGQPLRAQV